MAGGDSSIEAMIASTRRGILITRFWYIRGLNPRTISFTGLTRDGTFLIENGRISRPVNNFRFNQSLVEMLTSSRLTPIMVVHANHPREIVGECAQALRTLVRSGMTVLNQAVLLRKINDSAEVMGELCERLVDLGVMPYYLHQLDRVSGTAHFEVPQSKGLEIIEQLRHRLPGYAVPQYVREVPGMLFKTPLSSDSSHFHASY